jgi:hypothetical protein
MRGASNSKRWAVLLPLLGLAAWLALFGDKTPSGTAKLVAGPAQRAALPPPPAARPPASRRDAVVAEPVEALRPRTAPDGKPRPAADLFAVAAWRLPPPPPPPAAPVVQAKAAPTLPALNYRVLGKKEEDNTWEVYLGRDDMSFIARAGDTLEGQWRVDSIEPPTMALTHLPSNQTLKLPIGDPR